MYTCTDSGCTQCTTATYNQGVCLPDNSGGSLVGQCISEGVLFTTYSYPQCQGYGNQFIDATMNCFPSNDGSYYQYSCSGGGSSGSGGDEDLAGAAIDAKPPRRNAHLSGVRPRQV